MTPTYVTFLNHSSVLIRHGDEFLLTDPWFERPAFGSWLPTPPLFVHPAYLAALGDRLRILVSHGHDDHLDDDMLTLFDRETRILSSDFASPSVRNRVQKSGFRNFIPVGESGAEAGPFLVKSFRNEDISLDDALYTIRTPSALVIHCNDNWFELTPKLESLLREEIRAAGTPRVLYMSQTNSASGFPLNYRCFTMEEKRVILRKKVLGMMRTGMRNASRVGARFFHSYAGFASVFVEGKPEYLAESILPTPAYIRENLGVEIPDGLELLDFHPGDTFDFEEVRKSFLGSALGDAALKRAAIDFYEKYGKVKTCDSYRESEPPADLAGLLRLFLEKFDEFVVAKTGSSGFERSILGKVLRVEVNGTGIAFSLRFGSGIVETGEYNKLLAADPGIIGGVLEGRSLFENLYTGYNAEFSRHPKDAYNRDIVMYLVMYSYYYRNRVLPSLGRGGRGSADDSRIPESMP